MNLSEFQRLLSSLFSLGSLPCPSFPITKDIFDQLDANKDGVVDKNEWLNCFEGLKQEEGGVKGSEQKKDEKAKSNSVSQWNEVKNYEDLLTSVSKNRKLISSFVLSREKNEVITSN